MLKQILIMAAGVYLSVAINSGTAYAGPLHVQVAVLDTGLSNPNLPLCPGTSALPDSAANLHGTNIAAIIAQEAPAVCLVVYKVFDSAGFLPLAYIAALQDVLVHHYPIVNLSMVGLQPVPGEQELLLALHNSGTLIVVAAGNEHVNLGLSPRYPASLGGVIVVAASELPMSNYGGQVSVYRHGYNVCAAGICLSGTSQAAAIYSAELAHNLSERDTVYGK